MRGARKGLVVVIGLALAGGAERAAIAQEADDDAPARSDARPAVRQAARPTYQGVTPDRIAAGAGAPTRPPRRGRTPMVTWLGFQPQASGEARVFVQLDRAVPHEQEVRGGELVIALGGARAASTNTVRFLDTRFFDTPVERVAIDRARRAGGKGRASELELVIRFKDPADARAAAVDMAAARDGFTYLTVDVARGRGAKP